MTIAGYSLGLALIFVAPLVTRVFFEFVSILYMMHQDIRLIAEAFGADRGSGGNADESERPMSLQTPRVLVDNIVSFIQANATKT